jgi:hypothetical protein
MFHEGQFEGRKVKLPVFLGRPTGHLDRDLCGFYTALLEAVNRPTFQKWPVESVRADGLAKR